MATNRRAAQLLAASCAALTDTVARHMPAGPYRDFSAWAFSGENPRRHEFLQATGVIQLVNMNTTLLSGLVEDSDWPTMLHYAGLMNSYQVFEVVSDNLALGLGRSQLDNAGAERRTLVSALNRAMLNALTPDRRTPAVLLLSGPAREVALRTSGFDQSLAAAKHAGIAEEYARHRAAAGKSAPLLDELEYGLWSALVANVEICRDLVDALDGTATASLVRLGLGDRYRAVERTLHVSHLPRLELASLGAQSILVVPTLAYLVAVLAELLAPVPGYAAVVADSTLSDVLADAALLVRLQNDIGTGLLRMAPVQQGAMLHRLTRASADAGCVTADDALQIFASEMADEPSFTRLHKDLANDESNVALWHARQAVDAADALKALADSLSYYAGLYAQHSGRLAAGLSTLDERLGERRVSTAVERFVRFHERMYAHRHTDVIGEYAI
jgi:hypothetical protein